MSTNRRRTFFRVGSWRSTRSNRPNAWENVRLSCALIGQHHAELLHRVNVVRHEPHVPAQVLDALFEGRPFCRRILLLGRFFSPRLGTFRLPFEHVGVAVELVAVQKVNAGAEHHQNRQQDGSQSNIECSHENPSYQWISLIRLCNILPPATDVLAFREESNRRPEPCREPGWIRRSGWP